MSNKPIILQQYFDKQINNGGPATGALLLLNSYLKDKYDFIPMDKTYPFHGLNLKLFLYFYRTIKTIKPDIVHIRGVQSVGPLDEYKNIYGDIGSHRSIASIISYDRGEKKVPSHTVSFANNSFKGAKGVIGVVCAGNFTKMTMMPALKESGAHFKYIASQGGLSGTTLTKKFGFSHSTTDYKEILKDDEVDTLFVIVRHDLHAKMVVEGLQAGKNVFVEKPLALNDEELHNIIDVYKKSGKTLTVGFNRRFSPHIEKIKSLIGVSIYIVLFYSAFKLIRYSQWDSDKRILFVCIIAMWFLITLFSMAYTSTGGYLQAIMLAFLIGSDKREISISYN